MNKIVIGIILGAVLGVFDGLTAWFTPEVRKDILGIIIGSTLKGVVAGVAAGVFARKVQSTVAGIVFGLFVGLALAYWVAAMQGKYYFEIMLPGATVGAILGWATQRYGKPVRSSAAASMAMLALLFSVNAHASQPAQTAFDKLKTLAGTWNATMLKADGDQTTVVYRVTGNGSVIEETMFAGTDHEMINMYTVDGDQLLARHYCSTGNQPLLRYNAQKSNANQLVFDFVSKTGNDHPGHINGVTIRLTDDGKVVESWSKAADGPKLDLYLNSRRDPQSSR